jgi:hypothetical protein
MAVPPLARLDDQRPGMVSHSKPSPRGVLTQPLTATAHQRIPLSLGGPLKSRLTLGLEDEAASLGVSVGAAAPTN